MISRTSLLFVPLFLAAQHAPPEVEQQLRARVSGLYQNFLVSSFSPRKAEPFVAEDTKDYFYNGLKLKYISFEIGKIEYDDNFKNATVHVIGKEEKMIGGQSVVMDTPQITHWKIENGQWCWTYQQSDYAILPMPDAKAPPMPTAESATVVKPRDTSPKAIRDAGMAVLQQQTMGLDKNSVTFNPSQESSSTVVFTNGADGEIQIAVDAPVIRGLSAKLDKTTVPGHGTAVLAFHFDPSDKSGPKDVWEPRGIIQFRVIAAPFNRVFTLFLTFTGTK